MCALHSTYKIFSLIWMRSTLYAMHPTFMKSTPGVAEFVASWLAILDARSSNPSQKMEKTQSLFFLFFALIRPRS
jgi:hypothetical protein